MIVVPTVALADQWLLALSEDLGVAPSDIGIAGGGRRQWEGLKNGGHVIRHRVFDGGKLGELCGRKVDATARDEEVESDTGELRGAVHGVGGAGRPGRA